MLQLSNRMSPLAVGTVLLFLAGCSSAGFHEESITANPGTPNPGAPAPGTPSLPPATRVLADSHFHFVDFLQHTDGIEAALRAMDKAGVSDTMISGMPVVKKWAKEDARKPLYYLEDDSPVYWYSATDVLVARAVLSVPETARHRFHPFITGFNPTDRNAVEHIKLMTEWYPGLWEGIGEVMGHHDDLTALTPGEVSRPDGIALDPVFDFAAAHDLPVSIHTNIGSVWLREPVFLSEVEKMLEKHPKTRFIWCHAGISRRLVIPTLLTELKRMLSTHKNLWVDLSWVVFENYVAPEGKLNPEWVAIVTQFPDRFMIGSDIVGHFDKYPAEIGKYALLLDALPPSVAKRVGRDNFLSVLPGKRRSN